jgi:hypothetical protein
MEALLDVFIVHGLATLVPLFQKEGLGLVCALWALKQLMIALYRWACNKYT